MSTKNKNLFKEAIADAKAIKETALINAKQTIEEAFAPKIQEMFDSKLSEMEEDDQYSSNAQSSEDGLEEDFDLSSILAELDEEDPLQEGEGDDLDEKKEPKEDDDEKPKDSKPKAPAKPKETESKPKSPAKLDDNEDLNVSDLSVEDFTSLIKDIISQELGEGDVDLGLGDSSDNMNAPKLPGMGGEDDNSLGMNDDNQDGFSKPEGSEDEEDLNLEALLSELDGLNEDDSSLEDDLQEVKSDLKEAIKTINILRSELNETKILNSKLRYLSALLKEANLNSTQKIKIVEAFDKAKTSNEVKLVYESLKTNLLNVKKTVPIKESLFRTSSSKPIGTSSRGNGIIDIDNTISRMQKLANIK